MSSSLSLVTTAQPLAPVPPKRPQADYVSRRRRLHNSSRAPYRPPHAHIGVSRRTTSSPTTRPTSRTRYWTRCTHRRPSPYCGGRTLTPSRPFARTMSPSSSSSNRGQDCPCGRAPCPPISLPRTWTRFWVRSKGASTFGTRHCHWPSSMVFAPLWHRAPWTARIW